MADVRRAFRLAGTLSLLLVLVACGSKKDGTAPSEMLVRVEIAPNTTAIKIGEGETFTVNGIYASGSSKPVTATWESDAPAVLAIDGGGRASGVSAGLATITARTQGARPDTQLIQVVPNYQGTWQGDYAVTRCETSGAADSAGLCGGSDGFGLGDLLPIQITVTQSGTQLTGSLDLGEVSGPLTGSVEFGGTFAGTASLTVTVEQATLTTAVNPLRLRAEGERMTGSFTAESTIAGAPGSWILAGELRSVSRSSTMEMPRGREGTAFGTWREFVRALWTR